MTKQTNFFDYHKIKKAKRKYGRTTHGGMKSKGYRKEQRPLFTNKWTHLVLRDGTNFQYDEINRNISSTGYSARPNIDGVFQYWSNKNEHSRPISYAQYFRNGAVEYADSFILGSVAGEMNVHIKRFGGKFGHAIRRALDYQKSLGLAGPFYISVSLWNVKGMKLMQGNDVWESDDDMRFDREHVQLPHFQIDDSLVNEPFAIVKHLIEMICQDAGWEKCLRYQADGTWV